MKLVYCALDESAGSCGDFNRLEISFKKVTQVQERSSSSQDSTLGKKLEQPYHQPMSHQILG